MLGSFRVFVGSLNWSDSIYATQLLPFNLWGRCFAPLSLRPCVQINLAAGPQANRRPLDENGVIVDEKTQDKKTPAPGVFVTKGMKISIPSFSISFGESGELSSDGINLHTGLDMCPFWLDIAYEHLLDTESAHIAN